MESFAIRAMKKIMRVPVAFPYFVQLAITDACNLNCGMCPRHHVGIEPKGMEYSTFTRIVDRLKGVREISLVGLGEPFIYPKIFEAIKYCKSKGMIVKITTNGLLLDSDEKRRRLIDSGLDLISFSTESATSSSVVDTSAHSNSAVLEHIHELIGLRRKMTSPRPKIVIQPVLIKGKEDELYKLIAWAAREGVDRVNVIRMTVYFETHLARPDEREEKIIFREFSRLRRCLKIRIDCIQDQFYTGPAGFLYKYGKCFLRLDSFCTRLLDYPYITREGDIVPCCVLPKEIFGNILEQDLRTIWRGERFSRFRREHRSFPICSRCDNFKLKQATGI